MNPKGCPSPGETLLSLLKEASQNRLEALKATGTAGWAVDWADFGILVFHDFPSICGFQSVFILVLTLLHFLRVSSRRPVGPLARWPVGAMAEIVVCSATSGEELVTLKLEDLEQDSRNDVTPCDSLILFIFFSG